jgi:two-component system sensor histidine kinase PilS (NtrC family)
LNQLSFKRSDAQDIDILLSISPLRVQDGSKKGEILFIQDTTRLRRMEREIKRMEDLAMVGELAAGMAHEIRNPLASISGSIQVLNDGLTKKNGLSNKRLMEIVLREINRLNHLVNDFLQFARPKRMQVKTFDLNRLIAETLDLFQNSQSSSRSLAVETDLGSSIKKIKSDPEQLKQVIWNILLNAAEAMPRGGQIRVSTKKISDHDGSAGNLDSVQITVEDNGPGIDPTAIKDIFKPFSTTKTDGSGLGLAIVKRILQSLGGEVSGENRADGGAEVRILLPLAFQSEAPERSSRSG